VRTPVPRPPTGCSVQRCERLFSFQLTNLSLSCTRCRTAATTN
jgi:hypothetical protein